MSSLAALRELSAYRQLRDHLLDGVALSARFNRIRELRDHWLDLVRDIEQAGMLADPEDREELDYEASRMGNEIESIFGPDQESVAPYYALPTHDLAKDRPHRRAVFVKQLRLADQTDMQRDGSKATAWCRSAVIHAAGATAATYRISIDWAVRDRRLLLVETDSGHAAQRMAAQ
jgi:hypothetical protein